MFSKRERLKELAEYLVSAEDTEYSCDFNDNYKSHGIARVKTHRYSTYGLQVIYEKWFVEGYELASKMGLSGCELHDKLVAGTGVTVVSKKFGSDVFYGRSATDIINACEMPGTRNIILDKQTALQR